MKVELINHTPDPDRAAAHAALTCYSEDVPHKERMDTDLVGEILKKIKESGHHSVIEHSSFTFAVKGVSRALTHQLVRHRVASYSQQSQRYVDIDGFDPVIPYSVLDNEHCAKIYHEFMKKVREVYIDLKKDIPLEDARYVLPNATKTNIIVTMNARELWHFFSLRCCRRAQWEIREMAGRMLELCKEVSPIIFEDAGAPCLRGPCPEGDEFSCGRPMDRDHR